MPSVQTRGPAAALTWFGMMLGCASLLSEADRAELDAWDDQPGTCTSDWPGWARLGLPLPPWMLERLDAAPAPPRSTYRKGVIPRALARAVMERDAYRCRRCGTHLDLTCDHVVAESLGWPTTLANLQTLCRSCNSRKGIGQ